MKTRKTSNRGITLIALVITIIVLLIFAGVTIAILTGENGILAQASKAKERTNKSQKEEESMLNSMSNLIDNYTESTEGFDSEANANKPKLAEGMIPVKYEGNKWVKADSQNANKSWYEYGNTAETKRWANVVTVKEKGTKTREDYSKAAEGTEINMEDVTTMFVWIPRYSYNIVGEKNIEVSFLKGNTNQEANGQVTSKIVHSGFKMKNAELRGIWVAKFEASGLNKNGEQVGNASKTTDKTYDETLASTEGAYVTVKPSVPSWRHITIGESQYQSMKMSIDKTNYGWNNVNSHLMKNVEWGAVAYLCYSQYGNVPQINACGSHTTDKNKTEYYYNFMTGAGPNGDSESRYEYDESTFKTTVAYDTTNGVKASSTGNTTGVYDMNGGSWERVAAYLDNGNGKLNEYGQSTDKKVKYFENGKIKSEYEPYWEAYEVSEEERNNQIKIDGNETLKQEELWSSEKIELKYQQARQRITQKTYDNMAKHKGIGVNEVAKSFSFYALSSTTKSWNWFLTAEDAYNGKPEYGRAWDSDYVLIGHASCPFVFRGGSCFSGAAAGVFCSDISGGGANSTYGFRPVVVL